MADLLLRTATDSLRKGELAIDPTTGEVYRGDGTTLGGIKVSATAEFPTAAAPTMWVWDDDAGAVFARTTWDATDDLVMKWLKVGTNNKGPTLSDVGTVGVATAIGGTPNPSDLAAVGDDLAPIQSAGRGYFSGNHFLELTHVTVPGTHGLTNSDIGKRFSDATGAEFAITKIVSGTILQLVPKPKTLIDDDGYVDYRPAATGLTGLDGLGNIGSGAYSVAETTDTEASIRTTGTTSTWLVDGRALQTGETTRARKLELIVTNRIVDIAAAFAYFTANVGTATWDNAPIGAVETIRVAFYPTGVLTFDSSIRWTVATPIRLNNYPASLQSYPPAAHCWLWMPGAGSHTQSLTLNGGAVTAIDFAQPVRVATLSAEVKLAVGTTRITGVPVDTWIDLKTSASTAPSPYLYSSAYGFDPTYESAVPATRATNSVSAIRISDSSLKRYPINFEKNVTQASGKIIHTRVWRAWQKPTTESDWWTCVRSGDKWLVYVAWLTDTATKTITLPGYVTYTTAAKTREYLGTVDINGRTVTVTPSAAYGLVILALS